MWVPSPPPSVNADSSIPGPVALCLCVLFGLSAARMDACFFLFSFRSAVDVMDLWCLQAEATMSFMADKEKALRDLSLTLPFFLLEVRVLASECFIYL